MSHMQVICHETLSGFEIVLVCVYLHVCIHNIHTQRYFEGFRVGGQVRGKGGVRMEDDSLYDSTANSSR